MKKIFSAIVAAVVFMGAVVVLAHEVTYRGTVDAVEAARLQVKIVDAKTKKESAQWFNVGAKTKTKRGEKLVPYADAKIATGERVVLIVDHDSETRALITEIRLAVK